MSKTKNYTSKKGNKYQIHGGVYTGYSFTNSKGEKSALGFDDASDVQIYIEQRENGTPHFMDFMNDEFSVKNKK